MTTIQSDNDWSDYSDSTEIVVEPALPSAPDYHASAEPIFLSEEILVAEGPAIDGGDAWEGSHWWNQGQPFPLCETCGMDINDCVCEPCPMCGMCGQPECQINNGEGCEYGCS